MRKKKNYERKLERNIGKKSEYVYTYELMDVINAFRLFMINNDNRVCSRIHFEIPMMMLIMMMIMMMKEIYLGRGSDSNDKRMT